MKNKIGNLTDIISEGTVQSEINCGNIALESGYYEQAWDHFLKAYKSKDATLEEKGESSYKLSCVMKEVEANSTLINKLILTDFDLKQVGRTKPLTQEYARKYLGRKYLRLSAEHDYKQGLIEYGLACVDCGEEKGFNYDYNDENAEVGIAWANKMLLSKDKQIKQVGHIIYTKYYFVKSIGVDSILYINSYGDNLLQAKQLNSDNQYVNYFMGHLHANPKFKKYKNGEYYDPKKGYPLFCKVVEQGSDPLLVKSAKETKVMFETKYSSMIR